MTEAKVMLELAPHPFLIQMDYLYQDESQFFFAMPYIGTDMRKVLRK